MAGEKIPLSRVRVVNANWPEYADPNADADDTQPLDPRERRNWLRVMRAMLDLLGVGPAGNRLPTREAVAILAKRVERLGFSGPKEDAIRALLRDIKALEATKPD